MLAAGVLATGGLVYASTQYDTAPKVHWHQKFQVVVQGRNVSFEKGEFLFQRLGSVSTNTLRSAHIHPPKYSLIHNEGRANRTTWGDFFLYTLQTTIAPDRVVLPEGSNATGEYVRSAAGNLQYFVYNSDRDDGWTELEDPASHPLFEHDTLLLVYGNFTQPELADIKAAAPVFAEGEVPTDMMPKVTVDTRA